MDQGFPIWQHCILWAMVGGGLVVCMLAFYSDNQSLNPADACLFL